MQRRVTPIEWRDLLEGVLADTRRQAEHQLGHSLPPTMPIEVAGHGLDGGTYTLDEAAEATYLSASTFYRVIDIAVRAYEDGRITYWVRPSGHPPEGWDQTWQPSGSGPLKAVGLMAPTKQWRSLTGHEPPGIEGAT